MESQLTINLDRLEEGVPTTIEETLAPEAMEPHEADLRFLAPVAVRGEVYLARGALVLTLTCETRIALPCRVCNREVEVELRAKEQRDVEELEEHKEAEFDLVPLVRELVFLEVPQFVECVGGCAERESLESYLHKKENKHHPFADL
jgi:DUF177 domain-containing protein